MEQESELLQVKSRAELQAEYLAKGLVYYTPSEEKANAVSHFAGAVIGVVEMIILLCSVTGARAIIASVLIGLGTILVYGVSGVYHTLTKENTKRICRRFDHSNITFIILSCGVGLLLGAPESVFNYVVLAFALAVCVIDSLCCCLIGPKFFRIANAFELTVGGVFTVAFFVNKAALSQASIICFAIGGLTCLVGFFVFCIKKPYTHTAFHVIMVIGTTACFLAEYFLLTGHDYFLFPLESGVLDSIADAAKDSSIIFAIAFAVNLVIPFVEPKMQGKLDKYGKWTPLVGVCFGLVPQCGFSVIATDMYQKRHITVGALLGIYIATSDEALPIFLSNVGNPDKILMILPLLAIKFLIGLFVGYGVDFLITKSRKEVYGHLEHCEHEQETHVGCCGHEIEEDESKIRHHLLHPLKHSLKLFVYVLVVNVAFSLIILAVGEDSIIAFLDSNKYVAPLAAIAIGLIPNCVSSVILSQMYLLGGLGFGACLGGLCVNSGIALVYLFKDVKHVKSNLLIVIALVAVGITVGYATSLAFSFN